MDRLHVAKQRLGMGLWFAAEPVFDHGSDSILAE